MFDTIDSLEKLFATPANIAIIGSGKIEILEKIKSSYNLSLYRIKIDDRQGLVDAVRTGKKGILNPPYMEVIQSN